MLTIFAASFTVLLQPACKTLLHSGKAAEYRNPAVPGIQYKSLAVIASDDTDTTLRMSQVVRKTLSDRGVDALRRSGRWTAEADAILEICSEQPGQPVVQGVLIVSYDTLLLRECATRQLAFSIQSNGELTIDQMAVRLIDYLAGSGSGGS